MACTEGMAGRSWTAAGGRTPAATARPGGACARPRSDRGVAATAAWATTAPASARRAPPRIATWTAGPMSAKLLVRCTQAARTATTTRATAATTTAYSYYYPSY